jgi:hypothetical protein
MTMNVRVADSMIMTVQDVVLTMKTDPVVALSMTDRVVATVASMIVLVAVSMTRKSHAEAARVMSA